jgi:regulator-associated protein of mTOR
MYFTEKRHETGGKPKYDLIAQDPADDWRVKSRIKTVFAGLMLCLNIGVDPPDVVKTNPTATLEAWVDPISPGTPSTKIMEAIGKQLQQQYETLSIRIRYKQFLDPSVEETRRCCQTLRRNAKDERVLFHYNGHGVPLPTSSGEIWYFNRNYTQYIPVSLFDLQFWLGGPSIYVLDVSHAGNVIANFGKFIDKHEVENREILEKDPNAQIQSYGENIILAACGKNETLPTNPKLPADLFTSCLTTPVAISLRCFLLQSQFKPEIDIKDLEKVPGRLQERRTPLGELNWIFTAITDTIAWNCLPREIFKKLFRQDLMVAALFRNYLLADRLMRANGCHPETEPALPATHEHPLWQSWDLALEMVLTQLPQLIASEEGGPHYEYQHSSFFAEQLTAFEVYLSQGALERKAPDQLPIVLQVLLSQVHRLRALILLGRFLDLGPWAVNLALKIGIFPYVLKLLQSAAQELKPVLIFIWTRILAVDASCQTDLLRDNGYKYFLSVVKPDSAMPVANKSEHRAMSAFIVAMFCRNFPQAQQVSLSQELFHACAGHLADIENPLLRQWSCLCISMLWQNMPDAKWQGTRTGTPGILCRMALDPVPEVRAAALHALTTFLGSAEITDQESQIEQEIAANVMPMSSDGNSMVRNELLVFFSTFIKRYENKFFVAAYEELVEERRRIQSQEVGDIEVTNGSLLSRGRSSLSGEMSSDTGRSVSGNSIFSALWRHVLILSVDPHTDVSQNAVIVTDYVHTHLLGSVLGVHARAVMDDLLRMSAKSAPSRQPSVNPLPRIADVPQDTTPKRNESMLFSGLKRTASVALSLKNLALGGSPNANNDNTKDSQESPTPRHKSRVPDEWSRPPDANDPTIHPTANQTAKLPQPHGFRTLEEQNEESVSTIPLRSTFFDWSVEYFREPQMKTSEAEEPGSDDYNARLWRRSRNERIINTTQPLKSVGGSNPWNTPQGSLSNGSQPLKLCFHQFEDQLAVADDRDTICVWNWQEKTRITRFSNGNPAGSKINDVKFINEDDQALLVTGSSDGVVKVYRDYDDENKIEVVSSLRGLVDLVPSTKNSGLVLDWVQGQGKFLVAGDVKVIRIWNAATEICANEIPSRSQSCITALTSDQVAGQVFVAGFGNGKVQIFDQRLKPGEAMIKRYSSHKQWITNVHMQRGGMRELVSGSRNGEIKLWDMRMSEALRTIQATKSTLRTLSVHEHAPVFAT